MIAIREKVWIATRGGLIKTNPLPLGDFYSSLLDALLLILKSVDYPIVSPIEMSLRTLIADVRGRRPDRLLASANHILQWYFLADWQRLYLSCGRALNVIVAEQPDTFQLLDQFKDYVRHDCVGIQLNHDIVGFLETRCLFDRERLQAFDDIS